jgi:hypothetical protein
VYSCSEKKNQGRFRHVGSDHSLVSFKNESEFPFLHTVLNIDHVNSTLGHTVVYWIGTELHVINNFAKPG